MFWGGLLILHHVFSPAVAKLILLRIKHCSMILLLILVVWHKHLAKYLILLVYLRWAEGVFTHNYLRHICLRVYWVWSALRLLDIVHFYCVLFFGRVSLHFVRSLGSRIRLIFSVISHPRHRCLYSSTICLYDPFGRVYNLIHVVLGNHLVGSTKINVEGLNFMIRLVLILVHLNVRDYVWVVQRSKLALRVKFMIAFLELFELF